METLTHVVETKTIREFVLANPQMSSEEIALKLNVTKLRVGGTKASLQRQKNKKDAKITIDNLSHIYGKFMNSKGAKKEKAREKVIQAIISNFSNNKYILSLPFQDCIIEKKLMDISHNYTFLGCESDIPTYNNMLKTIAENNLPISTHRGTIGEIIRKAQENEFSDVILDYCGQLNKNSEDIRLAIERNIVEVGGTISITLNKRITPNTEEIYELMEKLNPKNDTDEMTRCEHAIRTFINRVGGLKYAIIDTLNYHDTASMFLIIIKRIA